MRRTVEKGRTLLVDGPASLSLLEGSVMVLGAPLKKGERLIVREGKRAPLEVTRKAAFDLALGEDASAEEVDGSTIPPSWEIVSREIASHKEPVTVVVMGGIDSGKSSFCVYLANNALEGRRRVAVIDEDLGQSDIGPPSTIGFSRVTTPIKDLFEMKAENAIFVGLTSPSWAVSRVLEGLARLKDAVSGADVDILIVNTDGWIDGEDAATYKAQLVERLAPYLVVGIQQERELEPILTLLEEAKIFTVNSPPAIRGRSREKRKILRELGYKKYLKDARVLAFSLKRVMVEGAPLGSGVPPTEEQMDRIKVVLGESPVYCEDALGAVLIVLRENRRIGEDQLLRIEESLGKRVKVVREGEEKGLLVALKDAQGNFLGIGVLLEIDYGKGAMKVYTPVSRGVSTVCIGQMKLDRNGREVGLSPVFADHPP